MMEADEIYVSEKPPQGLYISLESEEIRLLLLQPLVVGETIRCTLHSGIVGRHAQYEALSYMWGSPGSKIIEINGFSVPVRENLWNALYHLAPSSGTRTLWVDALCINQEDDLERNEQVTQMDRIYSQAKNTIIWLGESTKESEEVFHVVSNPRSWLEIIKSPYLLQESSKNIVLLCRREYWTRLWIFQEVILASSITLQCGPDSCSWHRLQWFLETLGIKPNAAGLQVSLEDESLNEISCSVLLRLMRQRYLHRHTNKTSSDGEYYDDDPFHGTPYQWTGLGTTLTLRLPPLLSVWLQYKDGKCQDPRDKIFGLRNLAAACCKQATPVDYTASLREIFTSVIHHHMDLKHSFSITIPGSALPRKAPLFTGSGHISCEFIEATRQFQESLQIAVKDRYCSEDEHKALLGYELQRFPSLGSRLWA
jgi:hypothetical protein